MFLNDQLLPQRDHKQHPQQPTQKRQHKNPRVLEIETKKDQSRQSEDNSGGNGLPRIARGLHDVVFENGGPPKSAQHADRKHGDRDGSSDRQARP
jgi:hypothetical protein